MRQPILSKVLSDIELRNYSEATKDVYLRTCARYLDFLGDKPLEATDESDIRAFSRHLRCDCGLAPKTADAYLAAVLFMYEVGLDRPTSRRQVPFMRKPKAMGTSVVDEKVRVKVSGARNLLYVATTRAVKNLRVLYVDDISPFTRGIEDVYGPARAVDAMTGNVI